MSDNVLVIDQLNFFPPDLLDIFESLDVRQIVLPPELWLEIFRHLDYATAKTLNSVCRNFKTLLLKTNRNSHTPIDKILFRDHVVKLPKELALKQEYKVHPLLSDRVSVASVTWDDAADEVCVHLIATEVPGDDKKYDIEDLFSRYYMNYDRRGPWWNRSSGLMHENLTSPAVCNITLEVTVETDPSRPGGGVRTKLKRKWISSPEAVAKQSPAPVHQVLAARVVTAHVMAVRMEFHMAAAAAVAAGQPRPLAAPPPSDDPEVIRFVELVETFIWLLKRGSSVPRWLTEYEKDGWREFAFETMDRLLIDSRMIDADVPKLRGDFWGFFACPSDNRASE